MKSEEFSQDRELMEKMIRELVGKELRTLGLTLVNVNIGDITDEENFIADLTKEACVQRRNEVELVKERLR